MEHEPCKFEDNIIKLIATVEGISTDIKWMKSDSIRRNGIYEFMFGGVFIGLGIVIRFLLYNGN